eukprot:1550225-Amphidinium_carterae.1
MNAVAIDRVSCKDGGLVNTKRHTRLECSLTKPSISLLVHAAVSLVKLIKQLSAADSRAFPAVISDEGQTKTRKYHCKVQA